MRALRFLLILLGPSLLLPGATLERLSMDDLSVKSTDIVRGRVTGARSAFRGSVIYTYYTVQVSERWKGDQGAEMAVAVPGGAVGDLRQTFSGAPKLGIGSEYVLFLWKGPSGVTQIMGLSQGLFDLNQNAAGEETAFRAPSDELMLDRATHGVVRDTAVRFRVRDIKTRLAQAQSRGAAR